MSHPKGPSMRGTTNEGPNIGKGSPRVLDQLNSEMAGISIGCGGKSGWEVIAKKSKNWTVAYNAKVWGFSTEAWCGSAVGQPNTEAKNADATALGDFVGADEYAIDVADQEPPDDSSEEEEEEEDDGLLDDVDCSSDESEKSRETRKKNKWLKPFFDALDGLKDEQINDPNRRWHCPACRGGPGAMAWYKGLHPLLAHAKTRGNLRIKLHREFAELLEDEILRRGTSFVLAGELLGKWKGLGETTVGHEIVWPPMVVVMNTLNQKDENDKWTGMGNQELIDYFSSYAPVRARQSYCSNGHRGISVLIFEASVMGYVEAERLHKQFVSEGRDRDAWGRRRILFYPGGKRQLYGFLASKDDMDIFNQHSTGRSLLKFEMKSYQEMVVTPLRKMMEDNKKLIWYKNMAIKQEQRYKAFAESFGVVSQKLRETLEENRIVRLRTKMQHEENKEEMDYQESFFKEQVEKIRRATEEKEQELEELLQKERAKAKNSVLDSEAKEDRKLSEEIESFISSQVKGIEELEAEREKLMQMYKEKKVEMKRKHHKEGIQLQEEFDAAISKLMDKCTLMTA